MKMSISKVIDVKIGRAHLDEAAVRSAARKRDVQDR